MRACTRCGVTKPLAEFPRDRSRPTGRHQRCKPCDAARHADDRAKNPERERSNYLRRNFGITVEQYEQMLQRQDGTCAICHEPPKNQALAVDHDHTTGQVRGLLCRRCNQLLGSAHDDAALLRSAADYIEKSPAGRRDVGLRRPTGVTRAPSPGAGARQGTLPIEAGLL